MLDPRNQVRLRRGAVVMGWNGFHDPSSVGSLSRQAYAAVRRAIRGGDLIPGRQYSEQQLAELLDMSRTPVREALIELEREGAIERRPQRGFMLCIPTMADLTEAYDLREVVEGYVVRRLAREATVDLASGLQAMIETVSLAVGSVDSSQVSPDVEEEFHLAMALALGLGRSYRALLVLRSAIWLPGAAADNDMSRLRAALVEHRQVVDRIAAHDEEGAVAAISRHISHSADAARERWSRVARRAAGSREFEG